MFKKYNYKMINKTINFILNFHLANAKKLIFFLLFFISYDSYSAGVSSKFINIVVDDSLYNPFNFLINDIANGAIPLNIKYANNDFYKNLKKNDAVNIFITQKNNRKIIERYFNIKDSLFLGVTMHCVCVNAESELANQQILSIDDVINNNLFKNIIIGDEKSSFYLKKNSIFLNNPTKNTTKEKNAISAMLKLQQSIYDAGIVLYPMCNIKKNLTPLYIMDMGDSDEKSITDYRIYVVNHMNENIESFLSFFGNSEKIYDLLKDYGIIGKSRQFSQK